MHIALVTETYWPDINGVAMTLKRVFGALAERGHSIQLVCTTNPARTLAHTEQFTLVIETTSFAMPGYNEVKVGLPMNFRLAKLWKSKRPDVVYIATEGPLGYFATQLARKLAIPAASGFHTNFQSYCEHYRLGALRKIIAAYLTHMHNLTQCTIVPTEEQRQMLYELGIEDIKVVGRGVDTSLFTPKHRSIELRSRWGANNETPIMIYVGRIAEEKNLDLTLKCYKLLKHIKPEIKFVMVGDGPAADRIKKTYPEIVMAGPRTGEDLAAHYASADFFPFTSMTETYGNVILEAMASGIGIMSYHYAAGKMHIQHGINGYHAPFGDETTYLETVRKFVEDPHALYELRQKGVEHAKQFNWTAISSGFFGILEQLAASEPSGPLCP